MKNILSLFLLLFISTTFYAQVEKVIVETYYVSDSTDATDTDGGGLAIGSKTYRIYIDLKAGSKLRKIYGDANHVLKIISDSTFFNNIDRGQSFAKDFSKAHFNSNTTALDTWLTLGQVSKTQSGKTYFGILKSQDTDGSFIGGTNNDGGSAGVGAGLLTNNNSSAGSPLTTVDGIDTMTTLPSSWADYGIINLSGDDSTIFGHLKPGNQFISNDAGLQNSGVTGVIPDSNQILVAQLTTKGAISFELNVAVEEPDGTGTKTVYYVANDNVLFSNEKLNRYLKYPFVEICGCPNPKYLEYKADRDCDKFDSCKTLIVLGCMDTSACNYDPNANLDVPTLCCFPGYCNDRDINLVCPKISNSFELNLYPNPSQDQLTLQFFSKEENEIKYEIYDSFGITVLKNNLGILSGTITQQINTSGINPGLYLFRVLIGDAIESKLFTKN